MTLRELPVAALLLSFVPVAVIAIAHQVMEPAAQALSAKPAPPEVEWLVENALRDRLTAGDIPDFGVVGGKTLKELYVRADMPASRMQLTSAALPHLPQTNLKLLPLTEAEERVARTGERVSFLTVDRVRIGDQVATVWLGADYIAPPQPGVVKLCCCEGEAHFAKQEGRWVFTKWGTSRCS